LAARENLPISVSTLDVDDDASVREGMRSIANELGPIDVLVNNAGIERTGSVEELPLSEIRAVMETNYFGPIRCIQAVLPAMRARRSGCIVNVASIAGRLACSPFGPYTASKFALEALSECLAQEVKAFGVRVAIVELGIIDTPMTRHLGVELAPSPYPQQRRLSGLYTASLENPSPPTLVAAKILEIVESGTSQLRHPVGPDALPFLEWRKAMSDEEWVAWGALDDASWYERVQTDFALDARR
jgi:NAD(P)-dependent dehydrogenase (short-subunit alcohol dehydrogenase family)